MDYIIDPNYRYPNFPDDLWPSVDKTTDAAGWQATIASFLADQNALVSILRDPRTDLYAKIPHVTSNHNIIREVIIVAEHNSYHIGEFGGMRGAMDLW